MTHGRQRIVKEVGGSEACRKGVGRKTRRVEYDDCYGLMSESKSSEGRRSWEISRVAEVFDGDEISDSGQRSGRLDRSHNSPVKSSESDRRRKRSRNRKSEVRGKEKKQEYWRYRSAEAGKAGD